MSAAADDPHERKERAEIWKPRINYSLPTLSGYWIDDLALAEQNRYLYAYKKEHCQLLIQKTRKMFRNVLRPTTLATEDPQVHFGRFYQIISYGPPCPTVCGKRETGRPLYLSSLISDSEIESIQHFKHGCMPTASPYKDPCVRNTFVLLPCDSQKTGMISYGEHFYIQLTESLDLPLYVQSENSTTNTIGSHPSLRLSQSPDIYCRFKMLHWNPQLRYETAGTFANHNAFVVIQHCASGLNLAAEFNNWIPTFFGSECTVSCHNFKDTHKMETTENLWKILGTVGDNMDFIMAARGDPQG